MGKTERPPRRLPDSEVSSWWSRDSGHQGGLPAHPLAGAASTAEGKFNCCLVYVLVTCGVVFSMTDFDPDLRILYNVCVVMCCPVLLLHCWWDLERSKQQINVIRDNVIRFEFIDHAILLGAK